MKIINNKNHEQELCRLFGKDLSFDHPMSEYTTFKAGGKAKYLYQPPDMENLASIIRFLNSRAIPYVVLGNCSNILVGDSGFDGVVILMRDRFEQINRLDSKAPTFRIGAGCSLKELLNYCRKEGLGGLEFLAGIPGTMGGAIAMNAGAFGKETGDRILSVDLLTPNGQAIGLNKEQLDFSYRKLKVGKGTVILGGCFKLDYDSREAVARRLAYFLKRRREKQPLEFPSAGSVFKNPPGDSAGRLIENAGLKGKRMGGAMISVKHANFIINRGGATAADILGLINLAREKVREAKGIELEQEIRVIGE